MSGFIDTYTKSIKKEENTPINLETVEAKLKKEIWTQVNYVRPIGFTKSEIQSIKLQYRNCTDTEQLTREERELGEKRNAVLRLKGIPVLNSRGENLGQRAARLALLNN